MKRLLAIVLALTLCAACAAAEPLPYYDDTEGIAAEGAGYDAAEIPEAGDAEGRVTLEQARYHFEHNALPSYFYEGPGVVLEVLEGTGTYRLWQSLAEENGVTNPYRAEDYRQYWYAAGDGATVLQIVMPRPEIAPLCFRAYMVYNPATDDAGYFTVEYGDQLGESALLRGWTRAMEHYDYGGAAVLDADDREGLLREAEHVAQLAGATGGLTAKGSLSEDSDAGLSVIPCPELGFSVKADPGYAWDYRAGKGITIYTEGADHIPCVIVWQSEDLIGEPFEYIREQYTPYIKQQYGDDLVEYWEYGSYPIGGRLLPMGVYDYRERDALMEMVRVYDSTGDRTVIYTAKYLMDGGDEEPDGVAELDALGAAIRTFKAY